MHPMYENKFAVHRLIFFADLPEIHESELAQLPTEGEKAAAVEKAKEVSEAADKVLVGVDILALRSFRRSRKAEDVHRLLKEEIEHVQNGKAATDEMSALLYRLKERDHHGYEIVATNDPERLLNTECIDGIVAGNKIEFVDTNGHTVIAYVGKDIGEGGIGKIAHVVYTTPENGSAGFAVIKKPKEEKERWFAREVEAAQEIASWNHPHIIKPLHIHDNVIVYETGENAIDLHSALLKDGYAVSGEEYFEMLHDLSEGLFEYQRRGKIHSDIKEANVLRMQIGKDPNGNPLYQVKIIDNTPLAYERFSITNRSYTAEYAFEQEELIGLYNKLLQSGMDTQLVRQVIGRAIDVRAYGEMFLNALAQHVFTVDAHLLFSRNIYGPRLAKYIIKLTDDPHLIDIIKRIYDPWHAGQPGFLEEIVRTVDYIKQQIRHKENASHPSSHRDIMPDDHETNPMHRDTMRGNDNNESDVTAGTA